MFQNCFRIEKKMNIKYVHRILVPESWKPETTITERSFTESDTVDHIEPHRHLDPILTIISFVILAVILKTCKNTNKYILIYSTIK